MAVYKRCDRSEIVFIQKSYRLKTGPWGADSLLWRNCSTRHSDRQIQTTPLWRGSFVLLFFFIELKTDGIDAVAFAGIGRSIIKEVSEV